MKTFVKYLAGIPRRHGHHALAIVMVAIFAITIPAAASTYATVDGYAPHSAEANNPAYWCSNGTKIEDPGGASYTITSDYSRVVVKAGSGDFANTIFDNVVSGEIVWADTNGDGVYNPGGEGGDKDISHIILCPGETPPPPPTDSTCTGLSLVPNAGDVPYSLDATISYTDPDALITGFRIAWGDSSVDYTGTSPTASHVVAAAGGPWTAIAYLITAGGEITSGACSAAYSGTDPPPPPPGEANAEARALACAPTGGIGQVYLVATNSILVINSETVHNGNLTVNWPAGTYVGTATADPGYKFAGDKDTIEVTVTVSPCGTPPPELPPSTGAGGPGPQTIWEKIWEWFLGLFGG